MPVTRTKPDQFLLRLPQGLRERIKARADEAGRSANEEIVRVLEDSFNPDNSAQLRKTIASMERVMAAMQSHSQAAGEATDATRAVADMYEQQVADLEHQLAEIASLTNLVAAAIKGASDGSPGALRQLLENAMPFPGDEE